MLQAELAVLQNRALFEEEGDASPKDKAPRAKSELTNALLRQAIRKQQLSVTSLQGALSGYLSRQELSPIKTAIRLGCDHEERREALTAIKQLQLQDARKFIDERSRGLDELKAYKEEERFESDAKDHHVVQFDVTPLYRAGSVRSVFDNVLFTAMNAEISISETLDNITIRENDDHSFQEYGRGIVYHRLASINAQGVMSESSSVVFYEYYPDSFDGLGSGLLVVEPVDEDELHPYVPKDRLRKDISAVVLITPHTRVVRRVDSEGCGIEHKELVVTLKRWALSTLHHTSLVIAPDVHQKIVDDTGQWMTEMIAAIRQRLSVYSLS